MAHVKKKIIVEKNGGRGRNYIYRKGEEGRIRTAYELMICCLLVVTESSAHAQDT